MSVGQRQQVISLYKRILRLSKTWVSKSQDSATTAQERIYIRDEARTMFRKNKNLTDQSSISDALKEAEARIEIAMHYRIPYPRPVNLPKYAMARRQGKEEGAFQKRLKQQAKPIYTKSID